MRDANARGLVPLALLLLVASAGQAAAFTLATDTDPQRVGDRVRVQLDDAPEGTRPVFEEAHATATIPGPMDGRGAHFTTVRWGWSELFVPDDSVVSARDAEGTRAPVTTLSSPENGWRAHAIVFLHPGEWVVAIGASEARVDVPSESPHGLTFYESATRDMSFLLARGPPFVASTSDAHYTFSAFQKNGDAWDPWSGLATRASLLCLRKCEAADPVVATMAEDANGVYEARMRADEAARYSLNFNITDASGRDEGVSWAIDIVDPATRDESAPDETLAFTTTRASRLVVHALESAGPGYALLDLTIHEPLPVNVTLAIPSTAEPGATILLEARFTARDGAPVGDAGRVKFIARDGYGATRDAYALPFGDGVYRAHWTAMPGAWTIGLDAPDIGIPEGSIPAHPIIVGDVARNGTAPSTQGNDSGGERSGAQSGTETPLPGALIIATLALAPRVARLFRRHSN